MTDNVLYIKMEQEPFYQSALCAYFQNDCSWTKESQQTMALGLFCGLFPGMQSGEKTQSSLTATGTVKCRSCGMVLDKDGNFCPDCGAKLESGAVLYPDSALVISHEGRNLEENKLIQNTEPNSTVAQNITHPPVFLGVAFYALRTNILYADGGLGKSLLSIEIAKSNQFKKCLFVLVDNGSDDDLARYINGLGEKAVIITSKEVKQKRTELVSNRRGQANIQTTFFYANTKSYKELSHYNGIKKTVEREMGINDQTKEIIDDIYALDALIAEKLKTCEIDFLCIDSLQGLFGDSRRLNRRVIERITQKAADNRLTLLCIHHSNKRGKIAGSSSIYEVFDYVYRLSPNASPTNHRNEGSYLVLEEEKARYTKPQTIHLKAIFNNSPNPKYELISQTDYCFEDIPHSKKQNLEDTILEILSQLDDKEISFEDLKSLINRNPPPANRSIKNSLKELFDRGVVQMAGDTWSRIRFMGA